MRKTILVLPDGREISSGPGTADAVAACTYTACVNSGTELTLGSVCAAMIELRLITPGGDLSVAAGDELTVYQETDGQRRKLGIFIAEKPARPSANTMHLTAYDRVSLLDQDLSAWLAGLTGWPYALHTLAQMVCTACGVTLKNTTLPNGSYLVQAFSGSGITGRRLMQWIGQAAGRFCRADADGQLEFAWYEPVTNHTVGTAPQAVYTNLDAVFDPQTGTLTLADSALAATCRDGTLTISWPALTEDFDGAGTLSLGGAQGRQHFYYQGSLRFEDYQVAPIEKVQIHQTQEDVGWVWPNTAGSANTYQITGNPLLTDQRPEALGPVAQTLYEQLKGISYTPCRMSLPPTPQIHPGHILTVTDRNGRRLTAYVMTKTQTGQRDTLECTGSPRRDSVSAVNEHSYTALSGKVLNLRTDVEGLRAENKAADGRMAALELNVDGITTQVQKQTAEQDALRTALTALQQTADAVKISVQTIRDSGVSRVQTGMGYTFDDQGLHIARPGEPMENKLDNAGMYVSRGGETILQANSGGVVASDVRLRNYLCIGENARLEDYAGSRTACFYVGG